MNGKKEESWMVELSNQRKTLFANLVFVETDDKKRIDELLRTKPVLANYEGREERWLVLDSWEGLYEHKGKGDTASCSPITCGDIREYGIRVAIPYVQKELEKNDTVLVMTNVFRTDDQLNNAVRGWSMSNNLNVNACTVIVFVDDKSVFPPEVWTHTRIVRPPRSTWDERKTLIESTQKHMKKHITKSKLPDGSVRSVGDIILNQISKAGDIKLLE